MYSYWLLCFRNMSGSFFFGFGGLLGLWRCLEGLGGGRPRGGLGGAFLLVYFWFRASRSRVSSLCQVFSRLIVSVMRQYVLIGQNMVSRIMNIASSGHGEDSSSCQQ